MTSGPPVALSQTYLCCRQSRRSQRTRRGKRTPSWGSSGDDLPSLLSQKVGKNTAGLKKGTSEGLLREWVVQVESSCTASDLWGLQTVLGGTISSSSHLLHRWRVQPGSVTVCGCSSMTAPQKGAPERRGLEERISSTRCVSSTLICHPLNLYCSSTGSISHIA